MTTKTANIENSVINSIEATEKRNAKIEVTAARYRKLQNMMTCRDVDYAISLCVEQLVEMTGFDKYMVMSIYADRT